MTSISPATEKLTRIYSSKRDRDIPLRISYSVEERNGCKIYELQRVEELQ